MTSCRTARPPAPAALSRRQVSVAVRITDTPGSLRHLRDPDRVPSWLGTPGKRLKGSFPVSLYVHEESVSGPGP